MSSERQAVAGDEAVVAPPSSITIRRIGIDTVLGALAKGYADFRATAAVGMAVGLFLAVGGWIIFAMVYWFGLIYLAYPTAAGFALIGPFVAMIMYEMSRRLDAGEKPGWHTVRPALRKGRLRLSWLPMITLFGFMIWIDVAAALYAIFFGLKSPQLTALLAEIFTTPTGLLFLLVGNAVGFLFAVLLFSISIMSYPLLMDRGVDAITAIVTSVKAVRTNPVPLLGYGLLIAILMGVGIFTAFVGLIVIMPFLGHATWNLYKETVEVID